MMTRAELADKIESLAVEVSIEENWALAAKFILTVLEAVVRVGKVEAMAMYIKPFEGKLRVDLKNEVRKRASQN